MSAHEDVGGWGGGGGGGGGGGTAPCVPASPVGQGKSNHIVH